MKSKKLKWLESMPAAFAGANDEVRIPLTLTMDSQAWTIYARAAKAKGMRIEDVLSDLLQSEDFEFENRGYKTRSEYNEERREKKEQATTAAPQTEDPGDWWKKGRPEAN